MAVPPSVRGTKGVSSRRLEAVILEVAAQYARLTVRQTYYILVARHGYPATRRFYKLLDYHLTKLRRIHRELYLKFVDTTRALISPPSPYGEIELWVEKDAVRSFAEESAAKYRVPLLVERGFGSLSMFRDALTRARQRGVKRILYIGDFDPSGLLIEAVNAREMSLIFDRIALTYEQIREYNPPSKGVNMRDSRTPAYIARYGDRSWEVEALDPDVLLKIVEAKLRETVPPEFLSEAAIAEKAAQLAAQLIEKPREKLTAEIRELLKQGLSGEEAYRRVTSQPGLLSWLRQIPRRLRAMLNWLRSR